MNVFSGTIINIQVHKSVSVVTVQIATIELKTIVIETPETAVYLNKGQTVDVLFKETEVVLVKNKNVSISIQNQIPGTIQLIEKGILLSKLNIKSAVGDMTAILLTEALDQLALVEGQEVTTLVQANEIMISG